MHNLVTVGMRFGPFIAQGNILLEAKDHPINIIKSLLDYNYEMTICGLHNDLNDNTYISFGRFSTKLFANPSNSLLFNNK